MQFMLSKVNFDYFMNAVVMSSALQIVIVHLILMNNIHAIT